MTQWHNFTTITFKGDSTTIFSGLDENFPKKFFPQFFPNSTRHCRHVSKSHTYTQLILTASFSPFFRRQLRKRVRGNSRKHESRKFSRRKAKTIFRAQETAAENAANVQPGRCRSKQAVPPEETRFSLFPSIMLCFFLPFFFPSFYFSPSTLSATLPNRVKSTLNFSNLHDRRALAGHRRAYTILQLPPSPTLDEEVVNWSKGQSRFSGESFFFSFFQQVFPTNPFYASALLFLAKSTMKVDGHGWGGGRVLKKIFSHPSRTIVIRRRARCKTWNASTVEL